MGWFSSKPDITEWRPEPTDTESTHQRLMRETKDSAWNDDTRHRHAVMHTEAIANEHRENRR